jgi:hypothetical protein
LFSVLPHDRRRRFEPDPDAAALVNEGAFSRNLRRTTSSAVKIEVICGQTQTPNFSA